MISKLEKDNFLEEIGSGEVLVDFFATWCGPCRMMEPILEEIVEELDIKVLQVDIDKFQNIAMNYQVMSIPNLILFKDGKPVKQNVGYMPKTNLVNWLNN
jgi:thioredoxin 1